VDVADERALGFADNSSVATRIRSALAEATLASTMACHWTTIAKDVLIQSKPPNWRGVLLIAAGAVLVGWKL
jgi:hypothetical protein